MEEKEALIKCARFYAEVSAMRRSSHRLAEADASFAISILKDIGVEVPDALNRGYGHAFAERVATWVREKAKEEGWPDAFSTKAEAIDVIETYYLL